MLDFEATLGDEHSRALRCAGVHLSSGMPRATVQRAAPARTAHSLVVKRGAVLGRAPPGRVLPGRALYQRAQSEETVATLSVQWRHTSWKVACLDRGNA